MKIIGVVSARNEEDIIELFARHNLNYVDELLIIENQSTDNTSEIIDKLIEEKLPIKKVVSNHLGHEQGMVISAHIGIIKGMYDFVVLLDADEFIAEKSKQEFQTKLSNMRNHGIRKWNTYLPPEVEGYELLKNAVYRKVTESFNYGRLILISSLLRGGEQISIGSHVIHNSDGIRLNVESLDIKVAHYPIRNARQFIPKILLGSIGLKNTPDDQAVTWKKVAKIIRDSNYQLSRSELRDIAITYMDDEVNPNNEVIIDPVPLLDGVKIKYEHLISTPLIAVFDKFLLNGR